MGRGWVGAGWGWVGLGFGGGGWGLSSTAADDFLLTVGFFFSAWLDVGLESDGVEWGAVGGVG